MMRVWIIHTLSFYNKILISVSVKNSEKAPKENFQLLASYFNNIYTITAATTIIAIARIIIGALDTFSFSTESMSSYAFFISRSRLSRTSFGGILVILLFFYRTFPLYILFSCAIFFRIISSTSLLSSHDIRSCFRSHIFLPDAVEL